MPTELDKEKNLQHAREVAFACILEFGIYSTTYEIIAKRSGLGVRTLRRYFRNKVDLICDVMNTIGKEKYRELFKKMADSFVPGETGLEQLQKFHKLAAGQQGRQRSVWLIRSEYELFMYQNSVSDEVLNRYLQMIGEGRELVKRILKKGIADGSIRDDMDVETWASLMGNSFVGLLQRMEAIRYVKTDSCLVSPQKQIDLYIEVLTKLLAAPQLTEHK